MYYGKKSLKIGNSQTRKPAIIRIYTLWKSILVVKKDR